MGTYGDSFDQEADGIVATEEERAEKKMAPEARHAIVLKIGSKLRDAWEWGLDEARDAIDAAPL